ncbi:MAG: F0F1 ATP synthase subunit gamma [Candidatus Omnitrophota bacterium]
MATVNEIKEELKFNRGMMDIVEIMKNIAVFQFRALQRKKERFGLLAGALEGFFRMVDIGQASGPFINPRTGALAIVMITSDEGFMGGLNLKVINTAVSQPGADNSELIVLGERGARYLGEIGKPFTAFRGIDFEARYKLASELKEYIVKGVKEGRFGRVILSYPNPVSFLVQRVDVAKVLPLSGDRGQGAGDRGQGTGFRREVIIESPLEGIVEYLAEQAIFHKLIEVFEDSKMSEFAARAIHLEGSGRDLAEKENILKLRYFHAYHEVIDKGTRELFAAQVIRRRR